MILLFKHAHMHGEVKLLLMHICLVLFLYVNKYINAYIVNMKFDLCTISSTHFISSLLIHTFL